jgi:hypothetical protein
VVGPSLPAADQPPPHPPAPASRPEGEENGAPAGGAGGAPGAKRSGGAKPAGAARAGAGAAAKKQRTVKDMLAPAAGKQPAAVVPAAVSLTASSVQLGAPSGAENGLANGGGV